MYSKKTYILSVIIGLVFFAFTPAVSFAVDAVVKNAGFAPGNIWFSKNDFVPGDVVKIYTILWNGGKETITGEVVFYDNDLVLDKVAFSLSTGNTKIASADWKVVEGYHKVYAVVGTSKIGSSGATLEYSKTEESEHFIGAPIKTTSPTSTAQQIVDQKINFAKEYATENFPAPVVETTSSITSVVESARKEVKGWSDSKSAQVQKNIEAIDAKIAKNDAEPDTWSSVKRPLNYVYIFLLTLVGYIFGNPFIFYGIIAVILFLFLRFIKRRFIF